MNSTNKNKGFVKIFVIAVLLSLVFTLSGFNVRDNLSPNTLQSQASHIANKAQDLYKTHAQSTVSTYIIQPGYKLGSLINTHIIVSVKKALRHIIDTAPATNTVPDPRSFQNAEKSLQNQIPDLNQTIFDADTY
jgi:predicted RND superfamily exporter protein